MLLCQVPGSRLEYWLHQAHHPSDNALGEFELKVAHPQLNRLLNKPDILGLVPARNRRHVEVCDSEAGDVDPAVGRCQVGWLLKVDTLEAELDRRSVGQVPDEAVFHFLRQVGLHALEKRVLQAAQ